MGNHRKTGQNIGNRGKHGTTKETEEKIGKQGKTR